MNLASAQKMKAEDPRSPLRPIRALRGLEFQAADGSTLKADVFRPADDAIYPMVLMIHGGAWSSGDKWNLHNHCHEMAQAGFVAVAINYRLAPLHRYPAQLEDARAALKWASQRASDWQGDSSRMAVWGYSAGAQLAGLLISDPQPEEPKLWAAVLGGAPCEFSFVPETSLVLVPVMGGTRKENPDAYRKASPLEFATEHVCPTFFFHGTTDLIVPQTSSQAMYDRLREMKVACEYCSVEGHGHLATFFDSTARKRAIEFLIKHLPASH
jgi:acetyl esterase/lipase